jgi:ectoine hydroxylase
MTEAVARPVLGVAPSQEQLEQFERDGYVVLEDALSPDAIAELVEATDRVWAHHRPDGSALNLTGFLMEDPAFLELIDHPVTFPFVCAVLGWNIFVFHSQLRAHPPIREEDAKAYAWHQDGRRVVHDVEKDPRPRLFVKASFWLTDVSTPDRGAMRVLPGSHLRPGRPDPDEEGVPICVRPGSAVIHDRRVWHARGRNTSGVVRRALFLGYGFRWLRQRDAVRGLPDGFDRLDDVRRQLLDLPTPTDGDDHYVPRADDIPLARLLSERASSSASSESTT